MGFPHMAHGRPMALTLLRSLVRLLPLVLLGLPIYAPYIKPDMQAPWEAPSIRPSQRPYAVMRPSMGVPRFSKHSMISDASV